MAHLFFFFFIILYSLCFFCCYFIKSTHAAEDSITVLTRGQTLQDGQQLLSPNRTFILGFFPSGSSSDSRYLGVKINTSLVMNPVWIANRDNPISDTNGLLSLDANGILRIERQGKNITILNSNLAASPTSNLTATLLDSGNFVLKEINNGAGSTERLLWQSFDYPTDTLLPGMKLSISNSNSGRNRSLTSWVSDKVPYSGAFTLGLDPDSNQLLIQRRGETYWRSGDWDDGRQFRFVPNLTDSKNYLLWELFRNNINFSYVSDKDERYFTYNYPHVDYPVLVWVLNSMGALQSYDIISQNSIASIQVVIECQANGTGSGGCETQKLPSCRTGYEKFQQRRGTMERRGPPPSGVVRNSDSLSDCEIRCRRNCSCIAYAPYSNEEQVGCQFWFTGSRFLEDIGSNVIYLLSSSHEGKKWWWLWLIISGSVVSAFLLLVSLCFFWWRRGKRQESEEDVLLEFGSLSPSHEHGKGASDQFRLFTYDSIVSATNNFSPKNKLGEGGFGPVYKGKLQEEQEIAVKRLSKSSGQGLKEFKNEIALIAKLQHMNLVRLLGCCIKGEEKMLIYEYMPNKSLDSFLFDPAGRRQLLDWKKRINIIEGIAQGLLYLHKYSRLRIIHRDLKASNILLDAEMNPKISDFGMAKIFGHGESAANTNRIVGTYGYMSPEYAMEGIFSVKSDVFSFGVLLLEIVSGRMNASFYHSDHHINLIGYAWDLWQKHAAMELVDSTLLSSASSSSSSFSEEIFLRCVQVGLLCVQESAEDRPTMVDVVSMLSNETMSLPQPKQPAFSVDRNIAKKENPEGKPQTLSQNGLTMSVMEAR